MKELQNCNMHMQGTDLKVALSLLVSIFSPSDEIVYTDVAGRNNARIVSVSFQNGSEGPFSHVTARANMSHIRCSHHRSL